MSIVAEKPQKSAKRSTGTYPGKGKIDRPKAFYMYFVEGKTKADIARAFNVDSSAVTHWLNPLIEKLGDRNKILEYADNETFYLKALRSLVVNEMLSPGKLEKASFNNLAYGLKNAFDIQQLAEGKATKIIGYEDITASLDDLNKQIDAIEMEQDRDGVYCVGNDCLGEEEELSEDIPDIVVEEPGNKPK